jgi:hypothetical protein
MIDWTRKYFKKNFGASLNNTKINFCIVKGYFNGENFVSLKGVGKTCQILCIWVNLIDSG